MPAGPELRMIRGMLRGGRPIDYDRYWRACTLALFGALLLYVAAGFDQHGISNDEPVQHTYGRLLVEFYRSGFTDLRAFRYVNLYLYGGLFDIIAAWLEPHSSLSVWDLRHLLTAAFGVSAIHACYLTARLLGSRRAGFLAALLLALTGAWSGALFTHTKDIPFGTAMIWAVYFGTRLVQQLPRPSWGSVAGAGISVGAALGLRVGGLFAGLYLGAGVLAVLLARGPDLRTSVRGLFASAPRLGVALLAAIAVMGFSWPWALMGWHNLFDAATRFSHFSFDMMTELDGQLIKIGQVPATYLSRYLLIRLPELLLAGLVSAGVTTFLALRHRPRDWASVAVWTPLLLAACFPILFSLATRPALYNGVRHFSFVLPPLAILGGIGLDRALELLRPRRVASAAFLATLLAIGADNLLVLARLHPYEYVAYNHLVGGAAGAHERYEGDYWSDSLREASQMLNRLLRDELGNAPAGLAVAVCAESVQATTFLDPRFRVVRDWPSADFYVSAIQTRCDRALGGTVIGEITRDGVPLAVIKDRRGLVGHERRVLGEDKPAP
ncbi:MAG: hypothetical protein RLZZ393_431 [Pseudomonadota bacterium]